MLLPQGGCYSLLFLIVFGRWFCHYLLWLMVLPLFYYVGLLEWQMFCLVVDVVTTVVTVTFWADVVAKVG